MRISIDPHIDVPLLTALYRFSAEHPHIFVGTLALVAGVALVFGTTWILQPQVFFRRAVATNRRPPVADALITQCEHETPPTHAKARQVDRRLGK